MNYIYQNLICDRMSRNQNRHFGWRNFYFFSSSFFTVPLSLHSDALMSTGEFNAATEWPSSRGSRNTPGRFLVLEPKISSSVMMN